MNIKNSFFNFWNLRDYSNQQTTINISVKHRTNILFLYIIYHKLRLYKIYKSTDINSTRKNIIFINF